MTARGRRRLRRAVDPVFVDRTGRRRRIVGLAGAAAALVLFVTAVIMLAGFTGAGGARLPGLPGLGNAQIPGAAPAPGQSATAHPTSHTPRPQGPDGGGSVNPSTGAGGGASATPSPSVTTRRTVPTQTPSHPGKKK
jgi:hypothetical protein